VELFRRVGSTPVDIRPGDGIVQELAIPRGVDDGKLHFRVVLAALDGATGPKKTEHIPVDAPEQPEKPANSKVSEAKDYLMHHNLEMRLSEAMRTVLRDRPEDPAAYIGERLAESAGIVRNVQSSQAKREDCEQAKPEPRDADDVGEQAKPGAAEALQEQAKPGDSDNLREQVKTGDADDLREQVKAGDADDLPKQTKPGDSDDLLREQAKQALLNASSSGQLERALTELKLKNSQQQNSYDSVREQARLTLLSASGDGRLDAALSDLKVEEEGPIENNLKEQAQQTLLKAFSDGRLSAALEECKNMKIETTQSANPKQMSVDEQAKQTLLKASSDGRLSAALEECKNMKIETIQSANPQKISVDEQAKQTLLKASSDGRLSAALEECKNMKIETTQSANPKKRSVDDLRKETKKNILLAGSDGRLASALSGVKGPASAVQTASAESEECMNMKNETTQPVNPKKRSVDELRKEAKKNLLLASNDGKLASALSGMKGPAAEGQTASAESEECMNMKNDTPQPVIPRKKSVEGMREETKSSLLLATNDGRLASALSGMKGPAAEVRTADTESVRLQTKTALLAASADGRLTAVLEDLHHPKTDAVTEDIRDQAKSILLSASQDGCLAAALAAAKQESPKPDTEDLRRQAKQTLLEASVSGHLDEALKDLRAQSTCAETAAHETPKAAEEKPSGLHVLPIEAMYGPVFYSCNLTPNLRIF